MAEMLFSGTVVLVLFLGLLLVAILLIVLVSGGMSNAGDALGWAIAGS